MRSVTAAVDLADKKKHATHFPRLVAGPTNSVNYLPLHH